jgi:hypothetical protein
MEGNLAIQKRFVSLCKSFSLAILCFHLCLPSAFGSSPRIPVSPGPDDVLPTGNQWIALPEIRARDGALLSFNVLSMHDRSLLQVVGTRGTPVLQPYFLVDGRPLAFRDPTWEMIEYWVPTAHLTVNGMDATLTYCAPIDARGAFLRLTLTNRRTTAVPVALGVKVSWGGLESVTYTPVKLTGKTTLAPAPWVDDAEVFSYVTNDTRFAWSLIHPGSQVQQFGPPVSLSPAETAQHVATIAPGETAEAVFVLGVGPEEFSATHSAKALQEMLDRHGVDAMVDRTASWCHSHTRTTGRQDLDTLMNRNFLFTAFYAWGRSIDTEEFLGVTSRSPRYYVSAAYWDRDAMLWSFPGLLDIGPDLARQALTYALTTQLRNTGTHSRFIDGIVLEDGFELDEAVAPLIATTAYVNKTGDDAFLRAHLDALQKIQDRIFSRYDPGTGLYSSLQDAQDEYQKLPFITYDNVIVWKGLLDLSSLYDRVGETASATDLKHRAAALQKAIMAHCVSSKAPGAEGPVFASATDGQTSIFTEIPPGSLMRLPALGFISEDAPIFKDTYRWLHSSNYKYSYFDQPYGLPGSYRLPITTSWAVADHLLLKQGHDRAMKVLLASHWDAGIISEGLDPATAQVDQPGRAFATAAGYMAHAICQAACVDAPVK